jgi:hypothetical protein
MLFLILSVDLRIDGHDLIWPKWYAERQHRTGRGGTSWAFTVSSPELGEGGSLVSGFRR